MVKTTKTVGRKMVTYSVTTFYITLIRTTNVLVEKLNMYSSNLGIFLIYNTCAYVHFDILVRIHTIFNM